MKLCISYNAVIFSIIFLLLVNCFNPISITQKTNQKYIQYLNTNGSQILYSPMLDKTTYLIDSSGALNHTWNSNYFPGVSILWLGNGTILRTISTSGLPSVSGEGGGVQKVDWNGNVLWDFRYNTNGVMSHHDIKVLPNGDILMIAWETKTQAEAIQAGRDPNTVSNDGLWPDHIIEVKPTGPTTGDIVWEWHVWDHLIQDYDSSKANYGVVKDHPELININFGTFFMSDNDWLHTDSIDYNPVFDQILISVHNFNEIWIIDHSTTTGEASGHTGGKSGHGGDLLYRWGNPQAYDRGTLSDEKFFGQHDASWINNGYPGEGDILVFNNGLGRSGGSYSSVDEIVPPVDENGNYTLEEGQAYGPISQTWIYTANPPNSFYVSHLSGAHRLPDGDTLITNGLSGELFEVTPEKTTVWYYNTRYIMFKAVYIPVEDEPPNTPSNPHPPDGAINVDVNASLSWTCSAPDGDSLTYDVYFGTSSNPPLVSQGQSEDYYNPPGQMYYNTNYYWKIVAWDPYELNTSGPVWSFTTGSQSESNNPPYTPSNPNPENGSINVPLNLTLSWTGGDPDPGDTVVYDVYLEANNRNPTTKVSDDQNETSFNPGLLEPGTIYYWKINAMDNHYALTEGPIWHFTISSDNPPNKPTINGPNSGKLGVSYDYVFNAVDPDGDQVKYIIDWGDGKIDTTALSQSGTDVKVSHTWISKGAYIIKAKAQDSKGLLGPEASFTVTMPRSKATVDVLLDNFLERFPMLEKLIHFINS